MTAIIYTNPKWNYKNQNSNNVYWYDLDGKWSNYSYAQNKKHTSLEKSQLPHKFHSFYGKCSFLQSKQIMW